MYFWESAQCSDFNEHIVLSRPALFQGEKVNKDWCVHFQGADRSVVNRTQRFNYEQLKQRPVRRCYFLLYILFKLNFSLAEITK